MPNRTSSDSFGLLGKTLTHSLSPYIHSLLGSYTYRLIELPESVLANFFEERDFCGLNVTVPYKKAVIPFCDRLSETARRLGSVNTIVNNNGVLCGYNTDYDGFRRLFAVGGGNETDGAVLVLGSGGAAAAVTAVLSDLGRHYTVISRNGENNYGNIEKHKDASIIINATPVGMYPDVLPSPLSLSAFTGLRLVFDLIYNPCRTTLMLEALDAGAKCRGGSVMLVRQAIRSSELFTGEKSHADENEIVRLMSEKLQNIVLIGMPGCGKSTVGKLLAGELGLPFIDTDDEILRLYGRTPGEMIVQDGKECFRRIETEVICSLRKTSGSVIACGGGVVSGSLNMQNLRRMGKVIFIDRDPGKLALNGRPLSVDIDGLYRKRLPLYRRFCDYEVTNREIDETVREILKITHEAACY